MGRGRISVSHGGRGSPWSGSDSLFKVYSDNVFRDSEVCCMT